MNRRNFVLGCVGMAGLWDHLSKIASAGKPIQAAAEAVARMNVTLPTLGGKQFWTDYLLFHDWRIQKNSIDGGFRLLDENDWRHASGSFAECQAKLEQIKAERKLPPMAGKFVLLLHGLFRTRSCMDSLGKLLETKGDFHVASMEYASTRGEVERHAEGLASILQHLDGVEEIYFVGHSLGNIVVRHYLHDTTDPQSGRQGDPRIKRFVMMGPPNNGAQIAEKFGRNQLFEFIVGGSGQQLAKGWNDLEKKLATPQCDFGIVAGGRGDDKGFNPLLDGDDDFVVTVESAKLPGARDFMLVPVAHSFLMYNDKVQEATLSFLKNGYFVSEEKRQPLAAK